MSFVSKSSLRVLSLISLTFLLAACGGLSAESAKERLLTADDFDFEVQVDSSPSDPSITNIFQGECSEIDTAERDYLKSTVVAKSEYEERSDSQNGFSLVLLLQTLKKLQGIQTVSGTTAPHQEGHTDLRTELEAKILAMFGISKQHSKLMLTKALFLILTPAWSSRELF
jgi:hypothetical protein